MQVVGLENSLPVQTGANTRKYMQVNANKSDSYLHLFAWVCIYFATQIATQIADICVGYYNRWKFLVRVIGLEPTRPKAPEPKSGASTNFATPAMLLIILVKI